MKDITQPVHGGFAVFFVLLACSCLAGSSATLSRTSFVEWERVTIKGLGFSLELPKGRFEEKISAGDVFVRNSGGSLYSFALHSINFGPLVESRYVIEAYFNVMTAEQYRALCQRKGNGSYYSTYAGTPHILHDTIKEYPIVESGVMGAHVFRRDFVGPLGRVVSVAVVRLDYGDASSWEDEDKVAITRIVNSVTFN